MKKLINSLLALALALSLVACGTSNNTDNRINAPASSEDLKGEDYQDVMTLLQVAGFTNIEVEILDDLILGWLTKDGEVEKISINGDADFSASSKFPIDARIVISYHTFPSNETEEEPGATATLLPNAETTQGVTASGSPELAELLDLNAINSTNSAESDAQFVGMYYRLIGTVSEAMEPSDGFNAMVIIHPEVMAKGMGSTLPLDINIWMTAAEFEKIGGITSVGKQIDVVAKLTSIGRNSISEDPAIKGYPIQLEFGEYD